MRVAALIEITASADGVLPCDLITRAYQASVFAPVILVVADELRQRVERELDPLVPQLPMFIPGVRYISDADESAVLHYARIAEQVTLATARLRALVGASVEAPDAPVSAPAWTVPAPGAAPRASAPRNPVPRSAVA